MLTKVKKFLEAVKILLECDNDLEVAKTQFFNKRQKFYDAVHELEQDYNGFLDEFNKRKETAIEDHFGIGVPKDESLQNFVSLGKSNSFKLAKAHIMRQFVLKTPEYGTSQDEIIKAYKDSNFKKGILHFFEYTEFLLKQEESKNNSI